MQNNIVEDFYNSKQQHLHC